MLKMVRLVAAMLSLTFATACAADVPPPAPVEAAAATPASSEYTLGSGDKLRITVFGEERLTGEYAVSGNGVVAFPLIGDVPAGDLSVTQLQEAIRTKLAAGYLRDPRVSVEVLDFRPYYISGEVNTPGKYPYTNGLTVQQAVATAGGFTYRANKKRIAIKRSQESTEQTVELRNGTPVYIRPGDTIRVLERFF
jgi:polysaccharide export outer membrane protein